MKLADLLRERLDVENQDTWTNERTPTPVRCFAVRTNRSWLRVNINTLRHVCAGTYYRGKKHLPQSLRDW